MERSKISLVRMNRKPASFITLFLITLSFLLVSSGLDPVQAQKISDWKPDLIVTTTLGKVKGFEASPDTFGWKGIPFARPPAGELRWKAPVDPEPWDDIREATRFCEQCPQFTMDSSRVVGSEDCLYLNIWRPNSDQTGLPVYFWIHGGGNSFMSASSFDGVNLSRKADMVVVTINYRLGPLGWFTHSSLRKGKDPRDDSGNYGTLDIIKALEWVRDNIRAFGGDPKNVTIAGESAGGINVITLLASPAASGLFHRAISESGMTNMSTIKLGERHVDRIIEKLLIKDGKAADKREARALYEKMSVEGFDFEKYLRSKSPEDLLMAHDKFFGPMIRFPYCFTGGTVICEKGAGAFKAGIYNQVPVILGTNKEENKLFMGQSLKSLGPEEYQRKALENSANWQRSGVDNIAEAITSIKSQPPVYAYRFDYGAYHPGGYNAWPTDHEGVNYALMMGAAHGLEISFFWGNFTEFFRLEKIIFREDNKKGREALSDAMIKYLSQFVRSGDPGEVNGLKWDPWSNAEGALKRIIFDADAEKDILRMSND